jgi:hypothetical protein
MSVACTEDIIGGIIFKQVVMDEVFLPRESLKDLLDRLSLMRLFVLDLRLEGFQGFLHVLGIVHVRSHEHAVF